ncbi:MULTISPECIES: hypothetical protein [unclassified Gilliamella]|nr:MULTISPECIES: hypothetical protein [unclassified Gilliamella]
MVDKKILHEGGLKTSTTVDENIVDLNLTYQANLVCFLKQLGF